MNDYKDFYPRKEEESAPVQQPEQSPAPEDPAQTPQQPAQPMQQQVPPPTVPQQPQIPPQNYYDDPVYRNRMQQTPPPPQNPYQQPYQRYREFQDPYRQPAQDDFRQFPQMQPPPPVPKEKTAEMNKKIYIAAGALAVMVFLLCVYCIGADIFSGALGKGDASTGHVTVQLKTQDKPELDPEDENVTADGEYTVRGVAELVKPSIVEVYTYNSSSRRSSDLAGTGSGIIISEDGYIITNAHVVEGAAYKVILDDEKEYNADLVGSDSKTDLAVLKINASGLTAAVLGNSDETYVGESVLAIGNPAGLTNSVTKGIVSAIGRQVRADSNAFRMECIQTDAAISPGNSGGALVNMYGQVIGITSSKYASQFSSIYEGLGFAISINEAIPVITDLMENGYVSGRFRIGITFSSTSIPAVAEEFKEHFKMDLPKELEGSLWISNIDEECDIHNTELKINDFITEVEGKRVTGYDDVIEVLDGHKGGDTVKARCAHIGDDGKITYYDISFKLEEDRSGKF